ncbi:GD22378 [Drosophila simulans]|uniref:GD22378 n=1 Tax=Drosophila simulans TaxID=7240 RepID=B4Q7B1_DROSI|nr:GD22378 [Drosophila simulans]
MAVRHNEVSASGPSNQTTVAPIGSIMTQIPESCYKMWGGRFTEGPHEALHSLNNSLPYDLDASKAYAEALHRAGLINAAEADKFGKESGAVAIRLDRGNCEDSTR